MPTTISISKTSAFIQPKKILNGNIGEKIRIFVESSIKWVKSDSQTLFGDIIIDPPYSIGLYLYVPSVIGSPTPSYYHKIDGKTGTYGSDSKISLEITENKFTELASLLPTPSNNIPLNYLTLVTIANITDSNPLPQTLNNLGGYKLSKHETITYKSLEELIPPKSVPPSTYVPGLVNDYSLYYADPSLLYQHKGLSLDLKDSNLKITLTDKLFEKTYSTFYCKQEVPSFIASGNNEIGGYTYFIVNKYDNKYKKISQYQHAIKFSKENKGVYTFNYQLSSSGIYGVEAFWTMMTKNCGTTLRRVYIPKFVTFEPLSSSIVIIPDAETLPEPEPDYDVTTPPLSNIVSTLSASDIKTDKVYVYDYPESNGWKTVDKYDSNSEDRYFEIGESLEFLLKTPSEPLAYLRSETSILDGGDLRLAYVGGNMVSISLKGRLNDTLYNSYINMVRFLRFKYNLSPGYSVNTVLKFHINTGGKYVDQLHDPITIVYDPDTEEYNLTVKYEDAVYPFYNATIFVSMESWIFTTLAENGSSDLINSGSIYSGSIKLYQTSGDITPTPEISSVDDNIENNVYFKYTNGESFTLNGEDYIGYINNTDGVIYTGKMKTDDSSVLDNKNTFINNIFSKRIELDLAFGHASKLDPYYINTFDVINNHEFNNATSALDDNNLKCFKNLIVSHPTIYNSSEAITKFYGLTSSNDFASSKSSILHIEPFTKSEEWSFMDNVITGTFNVDASENFKYIISTGDSLFGLSGNFISNDILAKTLEIDLYPNNEATPDYIHNIHYDPLNDTIIFVQNDHIKIYDATNFFNCNQLVLIDQIKLEPTTTVKCTWGKYHSMYGSSHIKYKYRPYITYNTNNPKFIKFSEHYRTSIRDNILKIINKYSSDVYKTYNLETYGVYNILGVDIRSEDSNVLILHTNEGWPYIMYINPETGYINNKKLYSISPTNKNYFVKFSTLDSNIFYVGSDKEVQSRFLSYPDYPNGRLELFDLMYPPRFIWNYTDSKFNEFKFKWNSFEYKSNNFNNLLTSQVISNDKMYMLHHAIGRLYTISQPTDKQYLNMVPIDLEKYFTGISCSESSIGVYINSCISDIVRDTVNMYNKSKGYLSLSEIGTIENAFSDISINMEDLYLNGNETLNVVSLQRIFIYLNDIQRFLSPIFTIEIENPEL